MEYLCIKDMSRMGRDYLKVGQIMEILRQRGVRLLAINDGVDSARGDDDFTPFRNIIRYGSEKFNVYYLINCPENREVLEELENFLLQTFS